MGTKVDGTVLVVRKNVAEKEAVKRSVNALNQVKAKIIGTVLNDVENAGGGGYYGYYGYGYYGKTDKKRQAH